MGQVVDVVADLVVVDIISDASLATEQLGLLFSLENFRTSEKTTGGNTVLDECGIVRATTKLRGDKGDTLLLVKLLKVRLNNIRASRTGKVKRIAVSIVDTIDIVRASNLVWWLMQIQGS